MEERIGALRHPIQKVVLETIDVRVVAAVLDAGDVAVFVLRRVQGGVGGVVIDAKVEQVGLGCFDKDPFLLIRHCFDLVGRIDRQGGKMATNWKAFSGKTFSKTAFLWMNTGMPLSGQVRGLGKRDNCGGRNNSAGALTIGFETQKPTKA